MAALNPDADSFEASKSPEETADATTNWDSVSEPEYSPVEGNYYYRMDTIITLRFTKNTY